MSDLERMVPADIEAEVDAIYNERYAPPTATGKRETPATTKGKAAGVMAVSGADFDEIAEVLNFPSARHAELAVQRALADSLDSWDKADLKKLMLGRFESLYRGAVARSQTKGYFAREAAAKTAAGLLVEEIKFLGLAAPSEHVIHTPVDSEIKALVERLAHRQISALPMEADVIEGTVVRDEPV